MDNDIKNENMILSSYTLLSCNTCINSSISCNNCIVIINVPILNNVTIKCDNNSVIYIKSIICTKLKISANDSTINIQCNEIQPEMILDNSNIQIHSNIMKNSNEDSHNIICSKSSCTINIDNIQNISIKLNDSRISLSSVCIKSTTLFTGDNNHIISTHNSCNVNTYLHGSNNVVQINCNNFGCDKSLVEGTKNFCNITSGIYHMKNVFLLGFDNVIKCYSSSFIFNNLEDTSKDNNIYSYGSRFVNCKLNIIGINYII